MFQRSSPGTEKEQCDLPLKCIKRITKLKSIIRKIQSYGNIIYTNEGHLFYDPKTRIKKKGWQGQLSCVCPEYFCSGQDLYEVHEIQTDYKYKNRVYICVCAREKSITKVPSFMHCAGAGLIYYTFIYAYVSYTATELYNY